MNIKHNDKRAESWDGLIQELYVDSWHEDINRFRSKYIFRGLSDEDYQLKTSLVRLGGKYAELENHIIRNFKKYSILENSSRFSIWNWLTIAQHHGLPTRLLDWTFSPFVALHFATSNIERYEKDGVIWCVDFIKSQEYLPEVLMKEMMIEGANSCFTVDMLSSSAKTLHEFDDLSEEDFVVFFDPPSMDARIVNQYALHSVISNPRIKLDDILIAHPNTFKRIIIPKALKWEIRDKLDQANINERVIFPGIDGLCMWLKRHYSPR